MMRSALLVLLVALLPACSALTGPKKDFAIYALDPTMPASTEEPVEWQLLVETPHVSQLLDDFRIVIATSSNERQVYKGARWVERTPNLLQNAWLRAFEADGRLPGASRFGTGIRADLILATDIVDFQARESSDGMTAEIEVHARLVDPQNRRIRARRVFRADMPATDNAIANIVAAFDAALSQINPSLIDWTVQEGRRALETSTTD